MQIPSLPVKFLAWEAPEDHLSQSSAPVSSTASDTDLVKVAAVDFSKCHQFELFPS